MSGAARRVVALIAALGVVLGLVAAGADVFAQQPQPGDKDPSKLPLGEVQPGGRQPMPGQPMPGQPMPGQPRPIGQPGQRPPGMPPGPPRPGPRQPVRPEPAAEEKGGHAAAHHCPGHGPMDSPHGFNLWQGLIGVNNDKATAEVDKEGHVHRTDSIASQLLWRYENEKDPCDPKNQPPPFLASLLNFGLLAFLIYRFGKKPLTEALATRKRTLMQEIDNATRLKEEAEARLADYEEKLDHLDDTLEEMKKDYVAQSEAERQHVLAEAEERRLRMKRDVEFRLEQELKAAKAQLLQEAVQQAVSSAEALLKSKVSAADRTRTQDEYLTGLAAAWKGDATRSRDAGGVA